MTGYMVAVGLVLAGLLALHSAPAFGFLFICSGFTVGILRLLDDAKGGVR